jgi:hypothetical protein
MTKLVSCSLAEMGTMSICLGLFVSLDGCVPARDANQEIYTDEGEENCNERWFRFFGGGEKMDSSYVGSEKLLRSTTC